MISLCLEAATSQFIPPTPLNPSYVEELREITLVWNYTLDGTVDTASFSRDTGGGAEEILPGSNQRVRFCAPVFRVAILVPMHQTLKHGLK